MFDLFQKVELNFFEGLPHYWKSLTNNFFIILANFTFYFLAGYQFFIFYELILHFLTLQEMNMLFKENGNIWKDFVYSWSTFREECEFADLWNDLKITLSFLDVWLALLIRWIGLKNLSEIGYFTLQVHEFIHIDVAHDR